MNPLDEIALHWGTDKACWTRDLTYNHGYTAVYHPVMAPRRNQPIKLLELGWGSGASAATWLEYFPNATIVILDDQYAPGWPARSAAPEPPTEFWDDHPRLHRYQGDQCSEDLVKQITDEHGLFDYIIDDASHALSKTMASFNLLWRWVKLGGYYIIEDMSTSFMNGDIGHMLDAITDTKSITIYPPMEVLDKEHMACIRKGTHLVTEYCDNPEWMRVQVQNNRYSLQVPTFMQPHAHMFDNWERERFDSMEKLLKPGDIFFDVGAEMGWQSLLYAQLVGPENMVLIEPCEAAWVNIRHTWERNLGEDREPLATYRGFMGETTNDTFKGQFAPWPDEAWNAPLLVSISYKYLWESADTVPQMKLDDFIRMTGHQPRAINVDVEGAELQVLRGCETTFKYAVKKPLVWVSIHPDLMARWYSTTQNDVHEFMASCGYIPTHLATDHEEHWLFEP